MRCFALSSTHLIGLYEETTRTKICPHQHQYWPDLLSEAISANKNLNPPCNSNLPSFLPAPQFNAKNIHYTSTLVITNDTTPKYPPHLPIHTSPSLSTPRTMQRLFGTSCQKLAMGAFARVQSMFYPLCPRVLFSVSTFPLCLTFSAPPPLLTHLPSPNLFFLSSLFISFLPASTPPPASQHAQCTPWQPQRQ